MKKDIFDKMQERLIAQRNAADLVKCAADPFYFLEQHGTVQHPTRGVIPFTMYDHQKSLIQSYMDNRFNIVHSARQVGTTTTNALYAMARAFLTPFMTVVIVSDRLRDSREILCRIKFAHENMPEWLRDGNQLVVNNKNSFEFGNGSRIFTSAATGDVTRGISADLVI